MQLFSKVKGYFVSSAFSIGKLAYSAGQTYFGMKRISNYFFPNADSSVKLAFPAVAVAGGLGVNLITRVPAIFKKFGPYFAPEENEKLEQQDTSELGYVATLFNCLFQASGHVSAFFTAINAHFGIVILSESIADFLNSDAHDDIWKESLVQSAACLIAITALATYYAYDFQMLKQNSHKIAHKIDEKDFTFDRNTAKMLAISALNLIASPILAKFWTAPALVKIPYAKQFLKDIGVNCVTWAASLSAFISGIATLPSIYAYFDKNEIENFSDTISTRALRYATYLAGGIDSLAAGLCAFIGVVDTAQVSFDLDPYGYILTYAIPSGFSASAQNGLFSVWPGYISLVKDINKANNPEAASLLHGPSNEIDEEINDEIKISIDEDKILNAMKAPTDSSDEKKEKSETSTHYYRDHETVGLMFNKSTNAANHLVGTPCTVEFHQEPSHPVNILSRNVVPV